MSGARSTGRAAVTRHPPLAKLTKPTRRRKRYAILASGHQRLYGHRTVVTKRNSNGCWHGRSRRAGADFPGPRTTIPCGSSLAREPRRFGAAEHVNPLGLALDRLLPVDHLPRELEDPLDFPRSFFGCHLGKTLP